MNKNDIKKGKKVNILKKKISNKGSQVIIDEDEMNALNDLVQIANQHLKERNQTKLKTKIMSDLSVR